MVLTEILKDCPKGTMFYSSYLGKEVLFTAIYDNCIECEYPSQIDSSNRIIHFRKDGSLYTGGECMLFPSKNQRDWTQWHRPFKDGDILTFMFWRKPTTYIYRENGTYNTSYYAAYSSENNKFYDDGTGALASNRDDLRFATEEEKQKLFDVIKDKGYKWKAETKTLEKIKKERFDPKTLQPFDKILVRDHNTCVWDIDFFGFIDKNQQYEYRCCGCSFNYCIPYNDDTKHLIGKLEDAPEFYRYWEE